MLHPGAEALLQVLSAVVAKAEGAASTVQECESSAYM
jgi:hypothetical protein